MSEATPGAGARGGCTCGRHRLRLRAAPLAVSYCHCSDCRRATGAPVSVFVGVRAADLELEGPGPAAHQPSAGIERWFCAHCGTPMAYVDHRLPDAIYLLLGVLDEPGALAPARHAFESERLPWLVLADDLPRHARFSVERPGDE